MVEKKTTLALNLLGKTFFFVLIIRMQSLFSAVKARKQGLCRKGGYWQVRNKGFQKQLERAVSALISLIYRPAGNRPVWQGD